MTKFGPWIGFNGDRCPCVGKRVQVCYVDGDKNNPEEGIAEDNWTWRFVWRYRVAES